MDPVSAGVDTRQSVHQDYCRQENGLEAEERSENLPAESPGRVNQLRELIVTKVSSARI